MFSWLKIKNMHFCDAYGNNHVFSLTRRGAAHAATASHTKMIKYKNIEASKKLLCCTFLGASGVEREIREVQGGRNMSVLITVDRGQQQPTARKDREWERTERERGQTEREQRGWREGNEESCTQKQRKHTKGGKTGLWQGEELKELLHCCLDMHVSMIWYNDCVWKPPCPHISKPITGRPLKWWISNNTSE